jgi:hypothetical protein
LEVILQLQNQQEQIGSFTLEQVIEVRSAFVDVLSDMTSLAIQRYYSQLSPNLTISDMQLDYVRQELAGRGLHQSLIDYFFSENNTSSFLFIFEPAVEGVKLNVALTILPPEDSNNPEIRFINEYYIGKDGAVKISNGNIGFNFAGDTSTFRVSIDKDEDTGTVNYIYSYGNSQLPSEQTSIPFWGSASDIISNLSESISEAVVESNAQLLSQEQSTNLHLAIVGYFSREASELMNNGSTSSSASSFFEYLSSGGVNTETLNMLFDIESTSITFARAEDDPYMLVIHIISGSEATDNIIKDINLVIAAPDLYVYSIEVNTNDNTSIYFHKPRLREIDGGVLEMGNGAIVSTLEMQDINDMFTTSPRSNDIPINLRLIIQEVSLVLPQSGG